MYFYAMSLASSMQDFLKAGEQDKDEKFIKDAMAALAIARVSRAHDRQLASTSPLAGVEVLSWRTDLCGI